MNGQTCLICDIEFGATIEVAKHIKKEHLDIIVILELRSEAVKPVVKTEIKQEIQGNLLITKLLELLILFTNVLFSMVVTQFIGKNSSFYTFFFFQKAYYLNGNHAWQTFFGFFFSS